MLKFSIKGLHAEFFSEIKKKKKIHLLAGLTDCRDSSVWSLPSPWSRHTQWHLASGLLHFPLTPAASSHRTRRHCCWQPGSCQAGHGILEVLQEGSSDYPSFSPLCGGVSRRDPGHTTGHSGALGREGAVQQYSPPHPCGHCLATASMEVEVGVRRDCHRRHQELSPGAEAVSSYFLCQMRQTKWSPRVEIRTSEWKRATFQLWPGHTQLATWETLLKAYSKETRALSNRVMG